MLKKGDDMRILNNHQREKDSSESFPASALKTLKMGRHRRASCERGRAGGLQKQKKSRGGGKRKPWKKS